MDKGFNKKDKHVNIMWDTETLYSTVESGALLVYTAFSRANEEYSHNQPWSLM